MALYTIRENGIAKLSLSEELARTATRPGQLATHLEHKHGLDRQFFPVAVWHVCLDRITKRNIVRLHGAKLPFIGPAAYAWTDDGELLPTFQLFPVARHQKPVLADITDGNGTYKHWVAPLKANCRGPW